MILSKSRKLIFIHVPKTGGTSVAEALSSAWADAEDGSEWMTSNPMFRAHVTAKEMQQRIVWDQYQSFAFVRNPWDRMVSIWNQIAYNNQSYPFHTFVVHPPNFAAAFLRPQTDYLYNGVGGRLVDYVGRYETLNKDFELVQQIWHGWPSTCPSLSYLNKHDHLPYQEYYTPLLQDIVAQRFASDVNMFDYEF